MSWDVVKLWIASRADARPDRVVVCGAIALAVGLTCFVSAPPPWGPARYFGGALLAVMLMAMLFRYRRTLES
jgi:hypothetical protein